MAVPKQAKRAATPAEFKAMAHPLRLRILRLCLHDAMTNKELADRLGQDPATVLHHVRMLVTHGLPRTGAGPTGRPGARLEKPYRDGEIVGASRRHPSKKGRAGRRVDALKAELLETPPDDVLADTRLGVQLESHKAEAVPGASRSWCATWPPSPTSPTANARFTSLWHRR